MLQPFVLSCLFKKSVDVCLLMMKKCALGTDNLLQGVLPRNSFGRIIDSLDSLFARSILTLTKTRQDFVFVGMIHNGHKLNGAFESTK